MNKRIRKKWAARFTAQALSIPVVLSHARPSFRALPLGAQCGHLRRVLSRPCGPGGLGVSSRVARYTVRAWALSGGR